MARTKRLKAPKVATVIGRGTTITGDLAFPSGLHLDGAIKGNVVGDVHANGRVELASNARVTGTVYYRLLEMAMGAEVNGQLVHRDAAAPDGPAHGADDRNDGADETTPVQA